MDSQRWKRIDELFHAALEIHQDKRSDFLNEECRGDQELRKEIETLLASDENEGNQIEAYPMKLAVDLLTEQRAEFAPGNSIGPYKILSMIGSGGMGEVYRASDSRIGRDVAIKILPPQLSKDSDRLRRFEQEARAAGMLNHPNILSIYDAGTSNEAPYLVSELLQGEVLQKKLNGRALPIRKAIDYALQIAKGLGAAHEKGITHRDLKPGNLFITKEGRVKILDFGLAKLTHPESISDSTETPDQTESGAVLGTVVYMSPEQVMGRKVDWRSDIFAFGSVLYEMLSGKRPFAGETQIETMHAILKSEPPQLSQNNGPIPPALERIVRRCLEKKPEHRFQSTSDLAFALEALSSISGTESLSIAPKRKLELGWILSSVFFVAAVILGISYFRHLKTVPVQMPSMAQRFTIVLPPNTVLNSSAISPDGQRLAYVTNATTGFSKLWLRSIDSKEAEQIPGTDNATLPFWSPDSKSIGFFTERELKTFTIGGGPPKTLCEVEIPKGGTWNQFGDIVFSRQGSEGLQRIPARGGELVTATVRDQSRAEARHVFPQFLPDGRRFLYLLRSPRAEIKGVYIGSLDSKEKKRILSEITPVRYIDPGYLLFVRNKKLIAQRLDPKSLELTGDAIAIDDSTSNDISGPDFSASENIMVYGNGERWNSQPVWVNRSGKQASPFRNYPSAVGEPGLYTFSDLSADDHYLLTFWKNMFWMVDLSTGSFSRYAMTNETDAVFSPDSSQVAYSGFHGMSPSPTVGSTVLERNTRIFIRPSNGTGKAIAYEHESFGVGDLSWTGDGKYLTFMAPHRDAKTQFDLWALPLQGDGKAFRFLQGPYREENPVLSPNGRWVAYQSYETGIPEIYVRKFPEESGGKWAISSGGAEKPIWRRDGKELFYLTLDKKMMVMDVETGEIFKPGSTRVLFEARVQPRINTWGIGSAKQYFVSKDGQYFLLNRLVDKTNPTEFNVILNWKSLLKK